jgi:hypothetical protein
MIDLCSESHKLHWKLVQPWKEQLVKKLYISKLHYTRSIPSMLEIFPSLEKNVFCAVQNAIQICIYRWIWRVELETALGYESVDYVGSVPGRNVYWTFRPKRNIHWTFSPLGHFIPMTIGLKVDKLYIHPKKEHFDPKIGTKCHNVTLILPVIQSQPLLWHLNPVLQFVLMCFMADYSHKLWHFVP